MGPRAETLSDGYTVLNRTTKARIFMPLTHIASNLEGRQFAKKVRKTFEPQQRRTDTAYPQ